MAAIANPIVTVDLTATIRSERRTALAEILRRIDADIARHEDSAEQFFHNRNYLMAIQQREIVEGLRLARLHVAAGGSESNEGDQTA